MTHVATGFCLCSKGHYGAGAGKGGPLGKVHLVEAALEDVALIQDQGLGPWVLEPHKPESWPLTTEKRPRGAVPYLVWGGGEAHPWLAVSWSQTGIGHLARVQIVSHPLELGGYSLL